MLNHPVPEPVRITQPFGYDPSYPGNSQHFHVGQDYGVVTGTPVTCWMDGTVYAAGWNGGYGNCVQVKVKGNDGNDYIFLYGHLSEINVSAGQTISAGKVVGKSGNTGFSTGPHLHWGVGAYKTVLMYWVDPEKFRVSNTNEEIDMTVDEVKALIKAEVDKALGAHDKNTYAHRGDTGSITNHAVAHESNSMSHRSKNGSIAQFSAEHEQLEHKFLNPFVEAMKAIRRFPEDAVQQAIMRYYLRSTRNGADIPNIPPPAGGAAVTEPTGDTL